jgi:hypothetical protein
MRAPILVSEIPNLIANPAFVDGLPGYLLAEESSQDTLRREDRGEP